MPVSIYLRLVDYKGGVLTTAGTSGPIDNNALKNSNTLDINSPQFIKVMGYTNAVEQTLNISSQSAGAGAGKITFGLLQITKTMDTISPILFQNAASGTTYKTVEVFFVNAQNFVVSKQTYKLVAIKSVSWSADGDSSVLETVSFEYGGQIMTVNKIGPDGKLNGAALGGWNKVKNIQDVDVDSAIN